MKRSLDLLLVFRFLTTNSTRLVSSLEECLDLLERIFEDPIPAHWSFAPRWLLSEASSRRSRLLERLKARQADMIVPLGYTGAYHPLLTLKDLENELKWAWTNPWKEGIEDQLGWKPEAMTTPAADLLRVSAREIYAASPFHLLLGADGNSVARLGGNLAAAPSSIALTNLSARRLAKALKAAYGEADVDHCFLIIDPIETDASRTEAALRLAARLAGARRSMRFASLRETELSDGAEGVDGFPATVWIPTDPTTRMARRRAPEGAALGRRSGTEASRRRLERLAPIDLSEGTPGVAGERLRPRERTLVADMTGDISLGEGPVEVRFSNGNFAGFDREGTPLLARAASRSYCAFGGCEAPFGVVSAFSFEDEACRGLRVVQGLAGERVVTPGRLVVDFFFHEECEELLASVQILYPQFAHAEYVDRYALLEIPLFELGPGSAVEIEGEYPRGERYAHSVTKMLPPFQLPGRSFLFRTDRAEFRITFPSLEQDQVELLPVRIEQTDRGFTLWINPRGSYARVQASALSGMEEQFSLSLTADAPGKLAKPLSAKKLSGIVGPDWMHRIA